jgi:hypothetical protein
MGVRIEQRQQEGVATLCIAGRLTSVDVTALRAAAAEFSHPMVLDLAGLQSADGEGLDAIEELRCAGAMLRGASPYLTLLLDRHRRPTPDTP